jgi:hypothetical protein
MAESNQGQTIRVLARPYGQRIQQALPGIERDTSGPQQENMQWILVNQATLTSNNDNKDDKTRATHSPCPTTKQKTIFKVFDLEDKAQLKMYTDLTGRFPRKSSCGH